MFLLKTNEIQKYYCKYLFWEKLNEEDKKQFLSGSNFEIYNKNEIIYSPNKKCKGIIKVVSGKCRIYMVSEEGREVALYNLQEGDICTLSASCVIDEVLFEIFMIAEEETKLIVTNIIDIKKIMENNVFMENFIYKETVTKFSEVIWTMQEMLFVRFNKRLADFLIKNEKKSIINITHEEIATQLGSAREVVSKTLKSFERHGWIKMARGEISLLDIKSLKNII